MAILPSVTVASAHGRPNSASKPSRPSFGVSMACGARLAANIGRLNEASDLDAMEPVTKLQGQYLAFIVAYTRLNRRAPAEADFQRYFEVTPPSVHNMILTLERRRLITRTTGRPRSIKVAVPIGDIPPLE